ncbi:tetratricopeptide repeat protein [bacterium]|nr:tetratricopeptide repeat protein [candidate division CSSED10-310 bacterium]
MGRFDRLEIPGTSSRMEPEQGETGRPIYDADRFMDLADADFWNGDYETSLRYFSKALRENAALDTAWLGQVLCLIRLGEFREALIWVDKALDRFPKSADLLAAKAVVYSRLGDKRKALDFSDGALNIRSDSPYLWVARGDVLLNASQKNARRCMTKAMEFQPDDWKMKVTVGDAYRESGYFRDALHCYIQAAEQKPDNARIWLMIGECRRRLGLRNAVEAFRHALDLRPGWTEARKLATTGQASLAGRVFRRLLHLR